MDAGAPATTGVTDTGAHPLERRRIELPPDLAARLARLEEERVRKQKWREQVWRERRALLIVLALVLLLLPNFRMARVQGRSMQPQFKEGDLLLVWKAYKYFSPLRAGDIIVFQKDGQQLVKRVAFVQNSQGTAKWPQYNTILPSRPQVSVKSQFFPDYARKVDRELSRTGYQQRSIYVLGDNVGLSDDSRDFGPIAPETILGKVILWN